MSMGSDSLLYGVAVVVGIIGVANGLLALVLLYRRLQDQTMRMEGARAQAAAFAAVIAHGGARAFAHARRPVRRIQARVHDSIGG